MLQRSDFYSFQNRIVEFIKANPRCAVWSFMGSGKTASTLTAFYELLDSMNARRMLVPAPLRVARKVWRDEISEWAHLQGLTIAHITGTAAEAWRALRTPADIHTINRERMMWLEAQFVERNKLLMKWPWDVIAVDESQSFKSNDAERYKSLLKLSKFADRMIELTGTPAPNGLHDLWAQYFLLDKGERLGNKVTAFRDRWFDCVRNEDQYTRWVPRPSAQKELYKLVADITLSLREEDYMDLPRVMQNTVRVQIDPRSMVMYRKLEKELILDVRGQPITAANAGALTQKLLQLANGAVYDTNHRWHEIHQDKIDALIEMLEFLPKALIAYAFQHDIERVGERLTQFCKSAKKKWTVLRSDESLTRWARGEFDFGVIHPATGGHGLNDVYKSGVEDLIWFGLTNNLEYYQQLNARLTGGNRRAGRAITVHHIICDGTKDASMLPLLMAKDAVQDDLRQNVANWIKEAR